MHRNLTWLAIPLGLGIWAGSARAQTQTTPPPPPRRLRLTPPKPDLGKVQEAREAAAKRGGSCAVPGDSVFQLFVLAPPQAGTTASVSPRLFWYLSGRLEADCVPVFTLMCDPSENAPDVCAPPYTPVEVELKRPVEPGVQCVELAKLLYHGRPVELSPRVRYRWYISIGRREDPPSSYDVAGAWVELTAHQTPEGWYDRLARAYPADERGVDDLLHSAGYGTQ